MLTHGAGMVSEVLTYVGNPPLSQKARKSIGAMLLQRLGTERERERERERLNTDMKDSGKAVL
jgi:hypothetical protein